MSFWNKAPFFRLLIPLIAGITAGIYLTCLVNWAPVAIIFLCILLLIFTFAPFVFNSYKHRWLYGSVTFLLLALSGFWLISVNTAILHEDHYSRSYIASDWIIAETAEPVTEKARSYKVLVWVQGLVHNDSIFPASGKILLYLAKDSSSATLGCGDIILVGSPVTKVKSPGNPSEFDYSRFLNLRGIYDQSYAKKGNWALLKKDSSFSLFEFADGIRKNLLAIYKKYGLNDDEFAVASALVLGYKDDLDKDIIQAYSTAGAMHVLSVSGLHVGIIFIVLNKLALFIERIRYGRLIKTLILIIALWSYSLLSGLSPSVLRAALMLSFVIIGKASDRNSNIYNTLAVSAFILLCINPYILADVGFQLSYLAVAGIVYIHPQLYTLWKAPNWLLEQVWTLVSVSIAAQFVTFPVCLLYFHQFPNYFLLSNLVVIPLGTVIIYGGLLLFALSPFNWLCEIFAFIYKWIVFLLNFFVSWIEQLPWSLTDGISITIAETLVMYSILFFLLVYVFISRTKWLVTVLAFSILLAAYQWIENSVLMHQRLFVVYNIKNSSAIDFFDGRESVLLTDSTISSNSSQLKHIYPNHWERGIKNKQHIILNIPGIAYLSRHLMIDDNLLQFYDIRLACIRNAALIKRRSTRQKITVDHLVIANNPKISLCEILDVFSTKHIIIDSSNNDRNTHKWLKEADEEGINCYSVVANGAYISGI